MLKSASNSMSNPSVRLFLSAASLIFLLTGCSAPEAAAPETAAEDAAPTEAVPTEAAPTEAAPTEAETEILPHPFTAEQIAGAMQPGFQAKLRTIGPGGATMQLWNVLSADEEGCEIEYTNLDADGNIVGKKVAQRAGWVELRNHASFPTAHASRADTERETALGKLSGMLYTVNDPAAGTTTEFFFAEQFPGAPVWMRTQTADGVALLEMEQIERSDA